MCGAAAALLEPFVAEHRTVRVLFPNDRAVVLGSTQPASDIDAGAAAAAGTAILRRRSGGGAVLVGPGLLLWVDVFVPAGDPLWCDDVGQAFWWLGDVWAAALRAVGQPDAQVWRGALVGTPWSRRICFAGLGPGEVTIGDAKVVGLSQRRTRAGAQFQCAVGLRWDPFELLSLLTVDPEIRTRGAVELAGVAVGVGADVSSLALPAFLNRLP